MSIENHSASSGGQASPSRTKTPHVWRGWKGGIAHPQSPDGGGGPGFFSDANHLSHDGQSPSAPDHPNSPQPLNDDPPPESTSPRINPAPTAVEKTVDGWLKKSTDQLDIDISYELRADKLSPDNFALSVTTVPASSATAHDPKNDEIGKFTWKGTIVIQTEYQDLANRDLLSCYGRGTTQVDLDNGDVTLGFHESCHRADFEAFLLDSSNKPELPELKPDMTKKEFKKATDKLIKKVGGLSQEIQKYSDKLTDYVGFSKTKYDAKKECFEHIPPMDEEE